jgi:hypothetical protein
MNKLLLIVLAILINCISTNVNPNNVVSAINCGGDEFRDSDGILYEKVNIKINSRIIISMVVRVQISEHNLILN